MERIDDLLFHGLVLIQDDETACFTEDAVLLAHFLRAGAQDRVVDLGCGSGVVSIFGQGLTGAAFCGVERQAKLVSLARRSAEHNGQPIVFYEMDVESAPEKLGHGTFTAAVMNPPYFASGALSPNEARACARHGGAEAFDSFARAAFLLLKNGGRLFLCWPADGLTDALCTLRANRLEPKRIELVPGADTMRLSLIEARKLGGPGVKIALSGKSGQGG